MGDALSKRKNKGKKPQRLRPATSVETPEGLPRALKIMHFIPAYNSVGSIEITGQVGLDCAEVTAAGHTWVGKSRHSCDLISMRNSIMYEAITEGFDYLFMQDADVFATGGRGPVMQLLELAQRTGAAMTGAMVMMRTRPARANVWPFIAHDIFEVEKMGTGMVMINLAKVREWYGDYQGPCFARSYKMHEAEDGRVFNPMREPLVGSDIWFCKVVRAHGQTIWCDSRIPTSHRDSTQSLHYDGHTFVGATDAADPADSQTGGQSGEGNQRLQTAG